MDVQVVDLDRIAGKRHLYFAMLNAVHSFQRGMNISRTLAVEFLLYASTQKQISEAIRIMGVDQNTRNLLVVAIGGDKESVKRFADRLPLLTNSRNDTSLLDQWSEKKIQNLISLFKINEKEIATMSGEKTSMEETVQKLILERVALLPTVV